LALHRSGKTGQATALLNAIRPILLQPYNRKLIAVLKENQLLADSVALPDFRSTTVTKHADVTTDHGAFKSVRARGVNALKKVESLRQEFARGSRLYPFLVGDEKDLSQLLDLISPPEDGGRGYLEEARQLDVSSWLKEHSPKPVKTWPKDPLPPQKTLLTQYHTLSQELKSDIFIGLIEVETPSEVFARLGFGDWNGCPAPAVHVALHMYWREKFGAEPIAIGGSTVECIVTHPPADKTAALALGREQYAYCDDIVEQGVGTVGKLASSLLGAKYWYFWWD
jgi:hypothetical protein